MSSLNNTFLETMQDFFIYALCLLLSHYGPACHYAVAYYGARDAVPGGQVN